MVMPSGFLQESADVHLRADVEERLVESSEEPERIRTVPLVDIDQVILAIHGIAKLASFTRYLPAPSVIARFTA